MKNFYDHLEICEGVDIGEDEIKKWVKRVGKKLKKSTKKYDMFFTSSGNMLVFGYKDDSDIEISVSKIVKNGFFELDNKKSKHKI